MVGKMCLLVGRSLGRYNTLILFRAAVCRVLVEKAYAFVKAAAVAAILTHRS